MTDQPQPDSEKMTEWLIEEIRRLTTPQELPPQEQHCLVQLQVRFWVTDHTSWTTPPAALAGDAVDSEAIVMGGGSD